jgi:serine/threonine-protein kinase
MALDLWRRRCGVERGACGGIVHRDIKPENHMVRPDGFREGAGLRFGQATEGSLQRGLDLQTRPGHLAGTIQYLSPEQVTGKPLDGRSDIFSLGVVAYELVTGRRPFDGPADGAIFDAILHHTPESPSSVHPQLGRHLDALVRRCGRCGGLSVGRCLFGGCVFRVLRLAA